MQDYDSKALRLYHGSTKIIEKPEFGKGNKHNDYGLGFYCTRSLDLAKEWASSTEAGGFANTYSLDCQGLRILDLSSSEYGILHWLTLLINNRIFSIANPLALEAKEYLSSHFMPNITACDLIIGWRADDSYFSFAQDFLNNAISIAQLNRAMALGELGQQFVLKSKAAFAAIEFQGYEVADGSIYHARRINRDTKARTQYLEQERHVRPAHNDVFMIDILREGMEPSDERLQ
jgi:hypothetical protein